MNTELKERKKEKFLNKIFSAQNIYNANEYGIITSAYKQIILLGIKIKIKINFSKLEHNLINQLNLVHNKLNKQIQAIYFPELYYIKLDLGYISGNRIIQNILESTEEKDKLLVKNLYKNLDDNATKNLNTILDRNRRVVKHLEFIKHPPKSYEVYTQDELKDLAKLLKFEREIVVNKNHFQWQKFKLPVNFFEPSVFYYKHGIDFLKHKETIQDTIIDVGANIGDSAIVLRDEFPDNKIICFEPEEKNYNLCLETLKLNITQNIIVEQLALGAEKYSAYIKDGGLANIAAKIADTGSQQVNITTLDDYVKENNIKVGLIKVDIEGFEKNFLEGAKETIRTQAPTLLLSIYHSTDDFFTIKPMVEEIMQTSPYKYRYDFFQPVYKWAFGECLLVCEKIAK